MLLFEVYQEEESDEYLVHCEQEDVELNAKDLRDLYNKVKTKAQTIADRRNKAQIPINDRDVKLMFMRGKY